MLKFFKFGLVKMEKMEYNKVKEKNMLELTNINFEKEVLQNEIPVLVDFWATWCGPCKMLAPELEQFAKEYEGKIKVAKLNIDDYTPVALQYGIEVIPTLLLFKNGKIEKKSVGFISKKEMIEKFLI